MGTTKRAQREDDTSAATGPEPYVGAEVVAKHLGVSRQHISTLATQERIPSFKVGRVRRFLLSEIDAWMHSMRSGEVSGAGGDDS